VFGFTKWNKTCAGWFIALHGTWITTQGSDLMCNKFITVCLLKTTVN